MIFLIVLQSVLTMLVYMAGGWALVKTGKAETSHAKSLSGALVYLFNPGMILNAFLSVERTGENIRLGGSFFLISLLLQIVFIAAMALVLRKRRGDARIRVLLAGSFAGNVGFFGLPLITAVFPETPMVAVYSMMFVMSMNLLLFTLGVFLITQDAKYMSLKSALINPTSIPIAIALVLYFSGVQLPEFCMNIFSLLGRMTAPICMIVLGMRLASMSLREIFAQRFAYLLCLLKLIVFPLFLYNCVSWMPWFDTAFKASFLILGSAPCASLLLSLAELHECEQELCADAVLMTVLLTVVTMPVMSLLIR